MTSGHRLSDAKFGLPARKAVAGIAGDGPQGQREPPPAAKDGKEHGTCDPVRGMR